MFEFLPPLICHNVLLQKRIQIIRNLRDVRRIRFGNRRQLLPKLLDNDIILPDGGCKFSQRVS